MKNNIGINETKHTYICRECKDFRFFTRTIGEEQAPTTRRIYCCKCGKITVHELEK